MPDRYFFPAAAILAVILIGLALGWPQGLGDRSPPPFGHFPVQRTAEAQAAFKRAGEATARKANSARETVRELQTQAVTPGQ